MPNRIIREGWIDSERIDSLNSEEEAFFLRLCLKADDFGRYTANPRLLASTLYPLRDDTKDAAMSQMLQKLGDLGLIRCYEVARKRYLVIPEFGQRTRATTSKYPDPPAGSMSDTRQTDDGHMSDTRQTTQNTQTNELQELSKNDGHMSDICQTSAHGGVVGDGDVVGGGGRTPTPSSHAGNHPPLEVVLSTIAATPGHDYSQSEIRRAFISLDAGSVDGNWMWGRRPAGDWRSALMTRIEDDRAKAKPKNGHVAVEDRPPKPGPNYVWRDGRWKSGGPNI